MAVSKAFRRRRVNRICLWIIRLCGILECLVVRCPLRFFSVQRKSFGCPFANSQTNTKGELVERGACVYGMLKSLKPTRLYRVHVPGSWCGQPSDSAWQW